MTLARDLINTPANDMGPAELEEAARALARAPGADIRAIVGDDLLTREFSAHPCRRPRRRTRAPRLIDLQWGDASHPRVTLVGKGVCFDTGGLDIKPEASMLNMKKDMGGAATVLALAHMIMARKLKVRLRVLIPAVENAISGAAFRPRDIYRRAKALPSRSATPTPRAGSFSPTRLRSPTRTSRRLIADFATLTGAARVALGPEVPPFFTDDDGSRMS